MRQFGFDQGAVVVLGGSCLGVWEAEGRFTQSGKDNLLVEMDSIFWPSLRREGALSAWGALCWLRCLEVFTQFVVPDSPDPVLLAPMVLIPTREPYLRANKEFEGSTLPCQRLPLGPQFNLNPLTPPNRPPFAPRPLPKVKRLRFHLLKIQRKRKESWQRPLSLQH